MASQRAFRQGGFQPLLTAGQAIIGRPLTNVLAAHPVQLVDIKLGTGLADTTDLERRHHLISSEHIAIR